MLHCANSNRAADTRRKQREQKIPYRPLSRVRSAMRKPTRLGGSLPMKSSAASMSMSLLLTSTKSIAITISFSVLWILRSIRSTFPTAKAMRRSAASAIGCAGKTGYPLSRPARSAVSNTPNGTRSGKGQAISKS